jgi:hypothetical protein
MNVTYSAGVPNSVPIEIILFIAVIGIALLILSVIIRNDIGDIFAILSPIVFLISAWQFLVVDVISDYGIIHSHTVYSMYPESVFMLILFGISVLNIYRIMTASNLITE